MKEEHIVAVTLMMRPNTADEFWLIPFVHKHEINAIQKTIEGQSFQSVERAAQVWVRLAEGT
jgi:hypothetical protein